MKGLYLNFHLLDLFRCGSDWYFLIGAVEIGDFCGELFCIGWVNAELTWDFCYLHPIYILIKSCACDWIERR